MNFDRSNDISLKYQRCTTFGSKAIGIMNSEFVAKTQILYNCEVQRLVLEALECDSKIIESLSKTLTFESL